MTSPQSRNHRTSSVWNLLKIGVACGLIVYVLSTSELTTLVSTLKNVSLLWLILSGILYVLLTLLKALQYFVLMQGSLTYSQVLNITVWQNAVSNFFLTGAGIAAYVTMTRLEHEVKVSRSMTVFLITKVGDLIAIWVMLVVASNLVWTQIDRLRVPVVLLITGIGSVILLFFLTLVFRQGFVSLLHRLLVWLKISRIQYIEKGLSYLQSLAGIEQNKLLLPFGLLLLYSFIYLAVTIGYMYANLAIFHLQLDVVAVIFVTVLIQLVSYFPVSVFGGLGITETSALYFWSFFGMPEEVMAPVLIGTRVVFYLLNLIPLIYLPAYSAWIKPREQAQHGQ